MPFGAATIARGPRPAGIAGPALRVTRFTGVTVLPAKLATQPTGWRAAAADARNGAAGHPSARGSVTGSVTASVTAAAAAPDVPGSAASGETGTGAAQATARVSKTRSKAGAKRSLAVSVPVPSAASTVRSRL